MADPANITWPGWETVGLIGRGSFGAVYKIQRDLFGETEYAALKVISIPQNEGDIDELYNDGYDEESITSTFQSHLKSIVAEYSLMRKMSGWPNIVNCDDLRYVQHSDGIGWDIFIKMELLTPLAKALPAQIPEVTVIQIAKDMCAALETCKKHGVVHRDIKPQNIFLSPDGYYKLGDFGIAKTVEKTMGGTKIGTYKYMAPEVYNNRPYGTAADIYSLGLVLYWMLNERRMPFLPLPPEKLKAGVEEEARSRRLAGEPLPPPAHGSEKLKNIVLKACAYDPKQRYQTATDMLHDVQTLFTDIAAQRLTSLCTADRSVPKSDYTPRFLTSNEESNAFTTLENQVGADKGDILATSIHTNKRTGLTLPNGFWKCACNRVNAAYVSSCACGINKRELILIAKESASATTQSNDNPLKTQYGANLVIQSFWNCTCGRSNAAYVSSCACGANKRNVMGKAPPTKQVNKTTPQANISVIPSNKGSSIESSNKFWQESEAAHRAWMKSLEGK